MLASGPKAPLLPRMTIPYGREYIKYISIYLKFGLCSSSDFTMSRKVIVIKLGLKTALGITALAALLLFLAILQISISLKHHRDIGMGLMGFLLASLGLAVLHECIHIVTMRALGVEILRIKTMAVLGIPVGLMVLYDEMSLKQYLSVALAPQVITAFFLQLSRIFSGALSALFLALYALHLVMSAGDFYGVVYTLIKAKTLKARLKCIMKEDRLEEIHIYLEKPGPR
ncbi:MAG: hypothetical protein DRJ59_03465 [Thermoprotei archaeon]|nr:MAG: hypothetical protein DRJ59_03465 [Thermoprotei archaeon]